jgi:hypothetical protein
MTAYLILFGFVFLFYGIEKTKSFKNFPFLEFAFFLIYLFSGLKNDLVGIDTIGYKSVYELSSSVNFFNFDYYYFEKGFLFLMNLLNFFNLDFRVFLLLVYFLIYFPIYLLIKKYSKDPFFSLFILLTYTFFVFFLSGLRNSIAISFSVLVFVSPKKNFYSFFLDILIILFSSFFHVTAIILLPFYLLINTVKFNNIVFFFMILFAILTYQYRNLIYDLLVTNFNYPYSPFSFNFGGNLLFQLSLFLSFSFLIFPFFKLTSIEKRMLFYFSVGFLLLLVTGESVLSRTAMYFTIYIIILIPNLFKYILFYKIIKLTIFVFLIFFILYYYLIPGRYDITPYKFFWE